MRIGAAAERAGVNVQTLRYYERRGLLPRPPRRRSGYREFPDDAVGIVRFVKRAQDLGFSLDEIEELLKLRNDKRRDRTRIRAVAESRVRQIDGKIAELRAMKKALAHLLHCCREGSTLECPIIEALDGAPAATPSRGLRIRGEVSALVRGGGGAPPPVKKRAPAAIPSDGPR
jgi:MerR family mercuric resistance operon transcriptional regulator